MLLSAKERKRKEGSKKGLKEKETTPIVALRRGAYIVRAEGNGGHFQ